MSNTIKMGSISVIEKLRGFRKNLRKISKFFLIKNHLSAIYFGRYIPTFWYEKYIVQLL